MLDESGQSGADYPGSNPTNHGDAQYRCAAGRTHMHFATVGTRAADAHGVAKMLLRVAEMLPGDTAGIGTELSVLPSAESFGASEPNLPLSFILKRVFQISVLSTE